MHSALYTGSLSHRRHAPGRHAFRYRMRMAWLDLGELDQVFRGRWFWSTRGPALAWLKRSDYLGDPAVPIDEAVRDLVERETGTRPAGPVRLLTHLRTFGHCFNPVSFYYCYDAGGEQVQTVVAEITNTPWNERHAYVLAVEAGERKRGQLRFRLAKRFHVSPFMPMEIDYDWRFSEPGRRLVVRMVNRRDGEEVFDATLTLERREINGANLAGALFGHPFATLRVVAAIYWQALRLWLKRVPFHAHPAKQE
jgi:uncharacterized protein